MATTVIDQKTVSRQELVAEAKRRIMDREDRLDAEIVRERATRLAERQKPKLPK